MFKAVGRLSTQSKPQPSVTQPKRLLPFSFCWNQRAHRTIDEKQPTVGWKKIKTKSVNQCASSTTLALPERIDLEGEHFWSTSVHQCQGVAAGTKLTALVLTSDVRLHVTSVNNASDNRFTTHNPPVILMTMSKIITALAEVERRVQGSDTSVKVWDPAFLQNHTQSSWERRTALRDIFDVNARVFFHPRMMKPNSLHKKAVHQRMRWNTRVFCLVTFSRRKETSERDHASSLSNCSGGSEQGRDQP